LTDLAVATPPEAAAACLAEPGWAAEARPALPARKVALTTSANPCRSFTDPPKDKYLIRLNIRKLTAVLRALRRQWCPLNSTIVK